ncbi:MAG: hypothetical protein MOGMAGMI_01334 [Candidatus Omnitrophica bacterium]|nr:hypothetical protein [Candidatus Omnitrophota bacterium]
MRATLLLLGGLTLVLTCIAASIRIDYSDSYEIYNNVLALMAGDITAYHINRFFLGVVMMTPFVWLQERFAWEGFALLASRTVVPVYYAATLWLFHRFCRMSLDRRSALYATILLGINPVLLRMSVTVKEDLPGLCLAMAAFYLYARSLRSRRTSDLWWAGLLIAAASAMRYNQMPVFPPVIAVCELADAAAQRRIDLRRWGWVALCCGVLPLVLFVGGSTVVHYFMGLDSMGRAFVVFVQGFKDYLGRSSGPPEPALESVELLVATMTPPLLVCALIGMHESWVQRRTPAVLAGAWAVIATVVHVYLISHKEARYHMLALPALYYFVPAGLAWVRQEAVSRLGSAGRKAATVIVACLLWLPIGEAARALIVYTDPIYTRDLHGDLGRLVKELAATGGKVYWAGPHYSVYPKDFRWHPKDDYGYIYHVFPHVVEYYARLVPRMLVYDNADALKDGDVLIVCRASESHTTETAPSTIRPLTVGRVRVKDFLPEIVRVEKGAHVFESVGDGLGEGEALVYRTDGTLECLPAELKDGSTIVRAPFYGEQGPDVERIEYLEYERPFRLDPRRR